MKIRSWLILLILITLSCSRDKKDNVIFGKPIKTTAAVQLNWIGMWKNEGYKEKFLYDMARSFEFENQDIILNIKYPNEAYPGKTDNEFIYNEIQKPQAQWDIIRVNNEVNGVANLSGDPSWPAKYLVDFSQYEVFAKNSIEIVLSDETKNRWGGIVPGHALDGHSFVLWCNKSLADKIGIKLKLFDLTAEDFENYCKALKNYNLKNSRKIYGMTFNTGWLPCYALGLQLFSSLVGDYNKLKDDHFSEEKLKAWEKVLTYLEELRSYDLVDPKWEKINYATDYDRPLKEECLFMINGTWMYNIFKGLDSVNYKNMVPLELPAFAPSKTYIGEISIPWAVPKNSVHKEEAVRFMLYWCRPDVADEWVRNTKSPTGIKGSLVQSGFGFDVYETFDYTIAQKYNGKKIPLNYDYNAVLFGKNNAKVTSYFKEVASGALSAKEAMRNIRSKLRK